MYFVFLTFNFKIYMPCIESPVLNFTCQNQIPQKLLCMEINRTSIKANHTNHAWFDRGISYIDASMNHYKFDTE